MILVLEVVNCDAICNNGRKFCGFCFFFYILNSCISIYNRNDVIEN